MVDCDADWRAMVSFLRHLPLRWPHEWPKHVDVRYIIKLHSYKQNAFMCLFNTFYTYMIILANNVAVCCSDESSLSYCGYRNYYI